MHWKAESSEAVNNRQQAIFGAKHRRASEPTRAFVSLQGAQRQSRKAKQDGAWFVSGAHGIPIARAINRLSAALHHRVTEMASGANPSSGRSETVDPELVWQNRLVQTSKEGGVVGSLLLSFSTGDRPCQQ